MAHLLRLTLLLLACLVCGLSAAALAPPQQGYEYKSPHATRTDAWRSDIEAACLIGEADGVSARVPGGRAERVYCSYSEGHRVKFFDRFGSEVTTVGGPVDRRSALLCPANSTLNGAVCECNGGFVESGGACVPEADPCAKLKGQSAGPWWKDTGDDNGLPEKVGFNVCDKYNSAGGGLCVVQVPDRGDTLCTQAEGGWWRCQGTGYYTGTKSPDANKCSLGGPGGTGSSPEDPLPSTPPVPNSNPPKPPKEPLKDTAAPKPCPLGQAPGSINGTDVCKPTGPDGKPNVSGGGKEGSSENPDGSGTKTSQSSTTKCEGDKCSTTTTSTTVTINAPGNDSCPAGETSGTTTNKDGVQVTTCTKSSTGTTTEGRGDFCKSNRQSPQCGGDGDSKGSFGGNCAAGFKAVGDDAVLNAMAQELYTQNCKVNPDEQSTQLAAAERMKTGNQTGDNPNNSSFSLSSSSFDTSDALNGGHGCIADKTVTVFAGQSVTLPTSTFCNSFELLGMVLLGVSFLTAAVIVMRG